MTKAMLENSARADIGMSHHIFSAMHSVLLSATCDRCRVSPAHNIWESMQWLHE